MALTQSDNHNSDGTLTRRRKKTKPKKVSIHICACAHLHTPPQTYPTWITSKDVRSWVWYGVSREGILARKTKLLFQKYHVEFLKSLSWRSTRQLGEGALDCFYQGKVLMTETSWTCSLEWQGFPQPGPHFSMKPPISSSRWMKL